MYPVIFSMAKERSNYLSHVLIAWLLFFVPYKTYATFLVKYKVRVDTTYVLNKNSGHFERICEIHHGDFIYGEKPTANSYFVSIYKVNDKWIACKNGRKYVPGLVYKLILKYEGVVEAGNSPYLDDPDLFLSMLNISKFIPRTNSKLPVYFAIVLALLLLGLSSTDSSGGMIIKIILLILLCLCIITHFLGYKGNTHWFTEDVGGLIRSTLAESAFLAIVIITIGSSLTILNNASEKGGFPTSFLVGMGSFVIVLPVYFILWIITDFPIRNTNYFLLFAQGLQLVILLWNCITKHGNIFWLLICFCLYPITVISCFLIAKEYIYVWTMGQSVILNIFTLISKGFW